VGSISLQEDARGLRRNPAILGGSVKFKGFFFENDCFETGIPNFRPSTNQEKGSQGGDENLQKSLVERGGRNAAQK